MGSSPTRGDIFFGFDLNWPFFISHVIKEGQENLKTQKFVQEMREIAIAIYIFMYMYILSSLQN